MCRQDPDKEDSLDASPRNIMRSCEDVSKRFRRPNSIKVVPFPLHTPRLSRLHNLT